MRLVLIGLAIGVCLVSAPKTPQGAFYAGMSIVALLVTFVPFKQPPPPPPRPGPASSVMLADLRGNIPVLTVQARSTIRLVVEVIAEGTEAAQRRTLAAVTIYETGTGTKALFTTAEYRTQVPGVSHVDVGAPGEDTRYVARIEAPGYAITSATGLASPGQQQVRFKIRLQPDGRPLFWQRLFRPPTE